MTEAVVLRGVRVVEPGVGVGPPTSVCLTGGRVVTLGEDAAACPARSVELDGLLLAPGLIDLQVNGAAGHDTTDDPASIWAVGEAIAATGVTAFLPTVITAALRTPWDLLAYPDAGTHLCTYSVLPDSLEALASALVGHFEPSGRLPVPLGDLYTVGHGL